MYNSVFISFLAIASVIVWVSFLYSLCQKKLLGRIMSGILAAALAALVFYMLAAFAVSRQISEIFYSLYFIANSWLCLSAFLFGRVYTGHSRMPDKVIRFGQLCMAIDNISLLLNPWTHHEVTYQWVQGAVASCWDFYAKPMFYLHIVFCYVLLLTFFVNIVQKLIKVPKLYKLRYGAILGILLICTLGDALYLSLTEIPIDVAIVLYGVGGILLYYFAFAFLPLRLNTDISSIVLNEMNAAIVFFDLEGKCCFANQFAKKQFQMERGTGTLEELKKLLHIDGFRREDRQIARLSEKGEEHFYKVEYQQCLDKTNHYLGCFFRVEDITQEREQNIERMYLATHDALTGIYNLNTFYNEAEEMLGQYPDKAYSIITTNIRQFKILNDLLGREGGDELLKAIGEACVQTARDDVVFGRMESDKFAVCAPAEYHMEEELDRIVTEKIAVLHSKYNLCLNVMNYYGVYQITEREIPISMMCDRANMALNTIKEDANRRIAFYDEKLREEMLLENQLLAELPQALRENQFVLYFQPQVDSRTNRIVGAEALVRWQHPQRGMISPAVFIPLLEKTGLIYQLDQYVWESACRYIKDLYLRGIQLPVSVNVSSRDIYSGDIDQIIMDLTRKYRIPEKLLNLEMTESAIIMDIDRMLNLIERLQEKGFLIEMDDFGSGYSSLNTLRNIPVDAIKLDRGFIVNALDSEKGMKILQSMAGLAQTLQIPTIAEGVEEEKQLTLLKELGCYNIQGFYYSRPIPFDKLLELLTQYEIGPMH